MGRKKKGSPAQFNLGAHNAAQKEKPLSENEEDKELEKAVKLEQSKMKQSPKQSPSDKKQPFSFNFEGEKKEEGNEEGKPNLFKFDFGSKGADNYDQEFDFAHPDEALVKMFQKKLSGLIGKSSGYLESLPLSVKNRVDALKKLHDEKLEIDKEFKEELAELEKKYEQKWNQLYDKRADIVTGNVEPTPEESGTKIYVVEEDEEGKQVPAKTEGEEKGIPNFWLVVLQHHDEFGQMIQEEDEDALKYLVNITVKPLVVDEEDVEDKYSRDSFELEFHFSENPYFENKILSKKYYLRENETIGEVFYDHMEATDINWKQGKNLTVRTVTKKEKGKGRKGRGAKQNTITVEEPAPSFFNFFSENFLGMLPEDEDEMDENEFPLEEIAEQDYELGVELKEKIIPNAILWFTGEVYGQDSELDSEEGYDEFDDEDDYSEGSDEDEEDEGEMGQAPQNQAPECKTQ